MKAKLNLFLALTFVGGGAYWLATDWVPIGILWVGVGAVNAWAFMHINRQARIYTAENKEQ